MTEMVRQITENLAGIRQRIADAADASGRLARDVQLVAVTKYVDLEVTAAVVAAGCHTLGESRPQHLWSKADQLAEMDLAGSAVEWHMIGHLQRNKVQRTLACSPLIHSADSLRLISAIDREAAAQDKRAAILLEVNISGDETKHGFAPDGLEVMLSEIAGFENIDVRGLMAMAHREGGPDVARRDFAAVRVLRDRLRLNVPEGISLKELSFGMSGDFEQAIGEGATIVRIGRAVFEGLRP